MENNSPIGVVLPAGGAGVRVGGNIPKQFLPLGDHSMVDWSLQAFSSHPAVRQIVLVLPDACSSESERLRQKYPKISIVKGGEERWQSVKNGVTALNPAIKGVLIHDVARPFLPRNVLDQCIESLQQGRDVIVALPAVDTLKQVDDCSVKKTLDRTSIIQVQTPQAFQIEHLAQVYKQIEANQFPHALTTDEAGLLEHLGFPVTWILGSSWLRKVTRPEDILWARWVAHSIPNGSIDIND